MSFKCPKGEILWVSYRNPDGKTTHILTSKPLKDFFFLYEISEDGNPVKLGRARSPTELEERFDIISKTKSKKGS